MMLARVAFAAPLAAALAVFALAGCTGEVPDATTSSPAPASSRAATAAPAYDAKAGATGNRAFFDIVNNALFAETPTAGGKKIIDSLVAAGFDKSAMEVTPDKTAIGLTADAIEFSVKFSDGCLLGQKGEEFGYTSLVVPLLDTGTCLVGETRPIDW